MHIAAHDFLLGHKVVLKQSPIDRRGWVLADAIVIDIAHHPDDLVPGIGRTDVYQFSDSGGRRTPIFAGEVLRHNGYWALLQFFRPGDVPPGHEWDTHGGKETRRHKLSQAQGSDLPCFVSVVAGKDGIESPVF